MPNIKVYVASPLGFSEAGRYYLKKYYMPILKKRDLELLDPWKVVLAQDSAEILRGARSMSRKQAIEIGRQNARMIKEADVVLAVLDGPDVDSGVATEIGYAYGLGKRIVGYRGDFRFSTDVSSCIVNLQVETFIKESGGEVFTSLGDALKSLPKR